MKISEKINMDINGLIENGPINIVAFGDSVTHGALDVCNNYETVYWNVLKKKINAVRDAIPVNVINAGIGGITAEGSIPRLQRDVLSHHPDLVIVCFGLNDVCASTLEAYTGALKTIFEECKATGADVIFMTPNMLNTRVLEDDIMEIFKDKVYVDFAGTTAKYQNEGKMDEYMAAAIATAKECGVTVCDCYAQWKKLAQKGVDTTMLLSNRINHPTIEMHNLFADMLFDIIFEEKTEITDEYFSTMYAMGSSHS